MNRIFTKCLAGGVALAIVVSASVAVALPTYLDLGGADDPVGPGSAAWNRIEDATAGSVADLVDSGNNSTGVGVSVTDAFWFPNLSGGDWEGSPTDWAVALATGDSFAVERPDSPPMGGTRNSVGAITFTGLDVGGLYNFSVISSRNAVGGRSGTITIGGADSDNGNNVDFDAFVNGFTAETLQVWTNVSPDGGGNLVLRLESMNNGASSFGYLNALSFELVPEPGSIALMGIGMVSMLLQGRRRS